MKVSELKHIDGFELLCGSAAANATEIKGCYIGDLLSWVMSHAEKDNIWITIMGHANIVAVASLTEVAAVIIAEGEMPDPETLKSAEDKNVVLISSKLSAYETAKILAEHGI